MNDDDDDVIVDVILLLMIYNSNDDKNNKKFIIKINDDDDFDNIDDFLVEIDDKTGYCSIPANNVDEFNRISTNFLKILTNICAGTTLYYFFFLSKVHSFYYPIILGFFCLRFFFAFLIFL